MNHRPRPAFSLVELVLAMALVSLVAVVLAGVMSLAGRSVESADARAGGALATSRILSQVLDELTLATSVTSATASKVEFTVGDCTGDGAPDSIAYTWSGAGTPLTRTLNGIDAVIAPSAAEFGIVFTSRAVDQSTPGANIESAEQILSSCTQSPSNSYSISSTTSIVGYIRPSFTSDVISWRPSRIELVLASNSTADGTITLHIHDAQPPARTGSILCSVSIAESSLSSTPATRSIALPIATQLAPTTGIMVQLAGLSLLTPSGTVYSKQTEVPERYGELATSGILGLGWTSYPEGALFYRLYGRTTSAGTTTASSNRLVAAAARLRISSAVQSGSATLVCQPNAPVSPVVADEGLVDSALDLLNQILGGGGG